MVPMTFGTRWLVVLGASCLVLAAGLHGLQLLSLGPWAPAWPRLGAWPTGFHLWIIETLLVAVAAGCIGLDPLRHRWGSWIADRVAKRRAAWLVAVLVGLQVLLALAFWLTRNQGVDSLGGLRAVFWLGGEFRLPTLFAVLQAWLAAWLAWNCHRQAPARVWVAATGVCLYIGLDELLSLHEAVGVALRGTGWLQFDSMNTVPLWGGLRSYAWKLFFLPVALVTGLWLLHGFLRVLDRRSVAVLVLAALVFVGGAVGFETVQASRSAADPGWRVSTAAHLNLLLEETLETAGMTLAVLVFARTAWRSPGRAAPAAFRAVRPAA